MKRKAEASLDPFEIAVQAAQAELGISAAANARAPARCREEPPTGLLSLAVQTPDPSAPTSTAAETDLTDEASSSRAARLEWFRQAFSRPPAALFRSTGKHARMVYTSSTATTPSGRKSTAKQVPVRTPILCEADAKRAIVDAYVLSQRKDVAAPLYIVASDTCDHCNVPLEVIDGGGAHACPLCGRAKPLREFTISNMAYSDGADCSRGAGNGDPKSRLTTHLSRIQATEVTKVPAGALGPLKAALAPILAETLKEHAETLIAALSPPAKWHNVIEALELVHARSPVAAQALLDVLRRTQAPWIRSLMAELAAEHPGNKDLKQYDRCAKIATVLTGFRPPRMTPQQQLIVRAAAKTLHSATATTKGRGVSRNFPGGYAYLISCICVLMHWDEFLGTISLPKNEHHLRKKEKERKQLYEAVDWEFIPFDTKASTTPTASA